MNERHPLEELKPFADGELGRLARRRVGTHLRSCASCGDELLALTATVERVQSVADEADEVPDATMDRLERGIMKQVQPASAQAPAPSAVRPRGLAWGLAGAAAAAVLTAGLTGALSTRRGTPEPERMARAVGGARANEARSYLETDHGAGQRPREPDVDSAVTHATQARSLEKPPPMVGIDRTQSVDRLYSVDRDNLRKVPSAPVPASAGRAKQEDQVTSPDADRFRAATAFGLPGKAASMDEVDAGMFLDGHSKVGGDRERLAGDTTYIARAASEPERLPSVVLNGLRANGEPKQPATTPTTLLSRMTVVRTAEITVHVTDLQKKYDELSKMVKAYRGFLADTEITTDDEGYRNGTIEVRVPPESFEDAVERIHQFGKVIASKVGADDVTGEYMQLEEQLPRLREREAELRQAVEKLKPSKDYSAKFLARERLAEVQSRIEQETFRLKFLKDQVKLSTISATLTERPANLATASARGDWSLAETAGTAWAQSLVLLRLLVTALIWVGVYFSVYLVLGMAIWYGAKKLLSLRQTPTQP